MWVSFASSAASASLQSECVETVFNNRRSVSHRNSMFLLLLLRNVLAILSASFCSLGAVTAEEATSAAAAGFSSVLNGSSSLLSHSPGGGSLNVISLLNADDRPSAVIY